MPGLTCSRGDTMQRKHHVMISIGLLLAMFSMIAFLILTS
jgi:hypothetical protein